MATGEAGEPPVTQHLFRLAKPESAYTNGDHVP